MIKSVQERIQQREQKWHDQQAHDVEKVQHWAETEAHSEHVTDIKIKPEFE